MPLLTVHLPVLAELRELFSDSIDSLEDLFCTAPAACMGSAELDSCAAHFTRFLAVGAMLLARLRAACVRLLFFCWPSEKAACRLSFAPAVAPSACRQQLVMCCASHIEMQARCLMVPLCRLFQGSWCEATPFLWALYERCMTLVCGLSRCNLCM